MSQSTLSLHEALAFHCAPALAGIKPACLVSLRRERYPGLTKQLNELGAQLASSGIRLTPVCICEERVLLLVYRTERLKAHLMKPEIVAFLKQYGYRSPGNLGRTLAHLRCHFICASDFPHEIGIFLGYPLEDVHGFICNSGEACKLSGYWKVYGDEVKARQTFEQYDRCRKALCLRIAQGKGLDELFQKSYQPKRRVSLI